MSGEPYIDHHREPWLTKVSPLLAAFYDLGTDQLSRGILDCEMPRDGETVTEFMRRKLRENGRTVPD